jgi:hypothetical protein
VTTRQGPHSPGRPADPSNDETTCLAELAIGTAADSGDDDEDGGLPGRATPLPDLLRIPHLLGRGARARIRVPGAYAGELLSAIRSAEWMLLMLGLIGITAHAGMTAPTVITLAALALAGFLISTLTRRRPPVKRPTDDAEAPDTPAATAPAPPAAQPRRPLSPNRAQQPPSSSTAAPQTRPGRSPRPAAGLTHGQTARTDPLGPATTPRRPPLGLARPGRQPISP